MFNYILDKRSVPKCLLTEWIIQLKKFVKRPVRIITDFFSNFFVIKLLCFNKRKSKRVGKRARISRDTVAVINRIIYPHTYGGDNNMGGGDICVHRENNLVIVQL